jgi:hypothetical protein
MSFEYSERPSYTDAYKTANEIIAAWEYLGAKYMFRLGSAEPWLPANTYAECSMAGCGNEYWALDSSQARWALMKQAGFNLWSVPKEASFVTDYKGTGFLRVDHLRMDYIEDEDQKNTAAEIVAAVNFCREHNIDPSTPNWLAEHDAELCKRQRDLCGKGIETKFGGIIWGEIIDVVIDAPAPTAPKGEV